MRCPKCQYVGFEPSPRCKNCGYDISLSGAPESDEPALTLMTTDGDGPLADFDLQILDDVPARTVQTGAQPFDLDDLLATGRSGAASASAPVIEPVSAVARRRQSNARSVTASASAVATPPPVEVETLYRPEPTVEPTAKPARAAARKDEPRPAPVVAKAPPAPPAPPAPVTTELPLFMKGMSDAVETPVLHAPVPASVEAAAELGDVVVAREETVERNSPAESEIDDRPLVAVPSSPRAPLAVRRTTPDPARLRAKYGRTAARSALDSVELRERSGDLLDGAEQLDVRLDTRVVPPGQRLSTEPTPTSLPAGWAPGVGPGKRLLAAALDSAVLLGLDGAVIWFTLSVCGLAPAEANLLPVVPLLVFFLLLDAGYLVLFTAACGQTIGKMVAGIRVVGTSTGSVINDRITIGQAVMRSLGAIASMLPLGAGFWFGLVGERRAAHDRLAHTRVVSA